MDEVEVSESAGDRHARPAFSGQRERAGEREVLFAREVRVGDRRGGVRKLRPENELDREVGRRIDLIGAAHEAVGEHRSGRTLDQGRVDDVYGSRAAAARASNETLNLLVVRRRARCGRVGHERLRERRNRVRIRGLTRRRRTRAIEDRLRVGDLHRRLGIVVRATASKERKANERDKGELLAHGQTSVEVRGPYAKQNRDGMVKC